MKKIPLGNTGLEVTKTAMGCLPVLTTRLTAPPGGSGLPAAGSEEMTVPSGTVSENCWDWTRFILNSFLPTRLSGWNTLRSKNPKGERSFSSETA